LIQQGGPAIVFWEKRSKACAGLPTSVTVLCEGRRLGRFQPLHLSEEGMLLAGKAPAAPGEPLELDLCFAGGRATRLAGLVARQGCPDESELFAVVFAELDGEAREILRQAVRVATEQASTATALVVDDSPEICAALRRELARLGHTVVAVGSVEAAIGLFERDNQLSVALVDLFLVADDGRALLTYLARERPGVRRVLMSGELALSRVPQVEKVAQGLLVKPWTRTALADALLDAPDRAA
jgi:CheY-like chemotaxis protein